jgi:amino acid transporter
VTVTVEKRNPSLRRQIGPVAMLFTGITSIIGSGWLFASLYAAQIAGPAAIISWFIGGGVALLLSLVYAELGGMLPCAGAIARIPYFSHGGLSSFIAGWLCWVAYVATAPIEVAAVLQYASNYLPWLTVTQAGDRVLTLPGLIAAAGLLGLFTGINLAGVHWLARANTAITVWKLAIPVLSAIALMLAGFHGGNFTAHGGFAPTGGAGIFAAVSSGGILFCFFGFRTAMDMAGEAKNPQRSVPLAMLGAVIICLFVYLLLQVAFIAAIPPAHLVDGWQRISETAAAGPFAAFAAILGMQWLAALLYFDAVLSPSGTGLAFTAVTARVNYAMAENRQAPRIFLRLNRFKVPAWALLFNFVVGFVLLLPFPGWAELAGFITSAAVLSLAFGPVSLTALRYQCPNHQRPFRLTPGLVLSPICFVITAYVIYWTGWDTNWKVFLLAVLGGAGMSLVSMARREPREALRARQSAWFWIYLAGLAGLSYLGNYGNGLGLLSYGLDIVLITIFSLPVFWLAVRSRLPSQNTCALIAEAT